MCNSGSVNGLILGRGDDKFYAYVQLSYGEPRLVLSFYDLNLRYKTKLVINTGARPYFRQENLTTNAITSGYIAYTSDITGAINNSY